MSEFAALPLFTDAYIADTTHLTCLEHGAYLRLLMIAWRSPHCALPDDDARLAMMLGLGLKRWLQMKPQVMAFWTLAHGSWTQKRLTREREFVRARTRQKRDAGRRGGAVKCLKTQDPGEADGSGKAPVSTSGAQAPTPTPTPTLTLAPAATGRPGSSPDGSDPAADLRVRIAALFSEFSPDGPPPEAGRAAVWLARGFEPALILAVIRAGLERRRKVRTLAYFDEAIAEAHERRPPPAAPASPEDPEAVRRGFQAMARAYLRDGHWSDSWGPRPGESGCRIPAAVLAEILAEDLAEIPAGADVAEARR